MKVEHQPAEETLREAEARYRNLVEESFDGIFIQKGPKITFANSRLHEMLGYEKGEMEGMDHWLIYHPDYQDLTRERARARMRGEEIPSHYEVKLRRKDGSTFSGEINARATIVEGEPGIQVWVKDISKRKKAEEALRASEEHFRQFFENAPLYCYMVSREGIILNVNKTALATLGYQKEELVGKPVATIYPPEYHQKMNENFETWKKTGRLDEVEMEIVTKKGDRRTVLLTADAVKDGDGRVFHSISVQRDITLRKKAEESLKDSERRYRQLFENVPVGLYRTSRDGEILEANPALVQMLGFPDLKSLKAVKALGTYVNPEDRIRWREIMDRDGIVQNFQKQLRRRDGSILWVEENAKTFSNSRGEQYYEGTLKDITGRKRAEEEKAALQEQLRQSQKMEAIGQLAGGVAHDFNNLLTVIKGYSQLSLVDLKENDPLKPNIEEIKRAADRAADLTRQLLAFGRRQVMEMRVLDLNTLLRNLEKMLRRLIGEDISLITHFSKDLGKVKVDPGQIEQVILNLVVNARDAMPNGGTLLIEIANVELDEAYAKKHTYVTPGRYVMLSVGDTGVGMAPEVRDRIFEPFFTTKEKGKGTGLGLSTVYGIVKQSGGNIWVYSEPGQGTTFKIYLPRVDEPLNGLKKNEPSAEVPGGNETVLIIEDEEAVRKVASRILKKRGYRVLEASRGDEAIRLYEESKEKIHLVLTDVVLPGMSGPQLIGKLRGIKDDFKVLYMSGYTDDMVVLNGALGKGANFIQKPFTFNLLSRKVREVLDG